MDVSLFVFIVCLSGVVSVFFPYPLMLWFLDWLHPHHHVIDGNCKSVPHHSVSFILAFRNPGPAFAETIQTTLAILQDRPSWNAVFASDGSDDGSEEMVRDLGQGRIELVCLPVHQGKTAALNAAVTHATNEVLVFFDADSRFDALAVESLLAHLSNDSVGGVSGRRCLSTKGVHGGAQRSFFSFDAAVKTLESRVSSLTSNEGKLYAIYRSLFQPLPNAVTDDLYSCLCVIRQGKRYLFDSAATVMVPNPLRTEGGELIRRRRIVGASLRTLWLNRELFVPSKYGLVSVGLFCNKVLRRLLPFLLVSLYAANLALVARNIGFTLIFLLQTGIYLLALCYPVLSRLPLPRKVKKMSSIPRYFVLGNIGTALGVWDFVMGHAAVKWNPTKSGGEE
ncbi:glycosyltransferase [Desulfovibrio inopinatus]|uniref:glycosyltransferase n=1 Tax=Desulfovibrio inopinatus TaxID=102109 RepID=UPI0003FBAABA|nr:glycosyltransferase [Desulfovibrio inopinatus]